MRTESGRKTKTALPHRRRSLFALTAFLLPLLLLAALEGGLRIAGFGSSYPLFVEAPEASGYLKVNPQVVKRFMVNEADSPNLRIRPVYFPRRKPPETFRIFIQGGSTAEGYPYGYSASLAGMLQQRLQTSFPNRRIEVITTAMSAVNSYTLLSFVEEILDQDPDAVLIYAGHNEYLGILGVGSGFSAGRRRPVVLAFLWLRQLRLFQAVQGAVSAVVPMRRDRSRRSLMATIAAEQEIPFDSDLYRRGIGQYRANMSALLERYNEAGVPVLIGTVASNERHQPPFVSRPAADLQPETVQEFIRKGRRALDSDSHEEALAAFGQATAVAPAHADAHFGRAQALDRLGRLEEARQAYIAAKDRDQLRFRAPEAINEVIRQLAARYKARLVNVRKALSDASPDGIIGRSLMLEHLHPNIEGYFEMADAYYRAFEEADMIGPWTERVARQSAWETAPVTDLDRLYGQWRAEYLMSDWPFTDQKRYFQIPTANTREQKIAHDYYEGRYPWPDAMRALLAHYRAAGNVQQAAKVAMLLAEAFPFKREDQQIAGQLLSQAGRPEAEIYHNRSRP